MSVEQLKEFSKKVVEEESLKAEVKAIGLEDVDGLAELARKNGYQVEATDFQTLASEVGSNEELSDDDLEQVSGGIVTALAAAVVGAAAGVVSAGSAVASTTTGSGW
ncbi:Nif11-like leader peptide family RiPP precursor [Catenovulum sediminis]|uniref:Nif11-like leader peptide family RiPP n=1 Tax=Catenovulum sediminis TaxID=1740262 RepID=A0ABV1RIY9_9ALTE